MSLIPDSELSQSKGLNMAPMVDLLFILLAVIIVAFITRAAIFDTEFKLVKAKTEEKIPIDTSAALKGLMVKVFEKGLYTLTFEGTETSYENVEELSSAISKLVNEHKITKSEHPVLLKIEKDSKWESVAEVILKTKQIGLEVRPLYEQER